MVKVHYWRKRSMDCDLVASVREILMLKVANVMAN